MAFIKAARKALDAAGLAHVRTIAADACGRSAWSIVEDMQKDPALAAAVDIIGVHNPGPISEAADMPPGTLSLGKPIWGTGARTVTSSTQSVPLPRTDCPCLAC